MTDKPQHDPTSPSPADANPDTDCVEPRESGAELGTENPPVRVKAEIPIELIDVDRLPICRLTLHYAVHMAGGVKFPAIKVARQRNGRYLIRDGRHRLVAARLVGKKTILAKFSTAPMEKP